MSRTVAFIQARMSSSRFPGKALEQIAGVPAIVYMAQRARRVRRLDEVVVITSLHVSDDPLAATLARTSLPVFRGELEDVLKRYADAAREYAATEIVRLTGDCPLIDPAVVDAVIDLRRASGADYASNIEPPTFPDGLDCECFTRAALERANAEAKMDSEREHVTLWMRSPSAYLRRVNVRAVADFSHLRLTVDYPDDLEAVRSIVAREPSAESFDFFDILRVLSSDSKLLDVNPHPRNEGFVR